MHTEEINTGKTQRKIAESHKERNKTERMMQAIPH
jgi:hypothetical protein